MLGHTLESRLGHFGLILDKNLKVFYVCHKQRPKARCGTNLFRFTWNQFTEFSFKLKVLCFTRPRNESLWRPGRYFGFERFLRQGFEVRVTLPLMSLSWLLFTNSRLADFESWRTQALPCNSSEMPRTVHLPIVRSVLQCALLHGDEYGWAPLARGCLQACSGVRPFTVREVQGFTPLLHINAVEYNARFTKTKRRVRHRTDE